MALNQNWVGVAGWGCAYAQIRWLPRMSGEKPISASTVGEGRLQHGRRAAPTQRVLEPISTL
jgi:hypothetical protein